MGKVLINVLISSLFIQQWSEDLDPTVLITEPFLETFVKQKSSSLCSWINDTIFITVFQKDIVENVQEKL